MPKKQTKDSPKKRIPEARENQWLEDWIAPVVAFVAVSSMLFAVVWILLSPAN
jgi:hypothetical protein